MIVSQYHLLLAARTSSPPRCASLVLKLIQLLKGGQRHPRQLTQTSSKIHNRMRENRSFNADSRNAVDNHRGSGEPAPREAITSAAPWDPETGTQGHDASDTKQQQHDMSQPEDPRSGTKGSEWICTLTGRANQELHLLRLP